MAITSNPDIELATREPVEQPPTATPTNLALVMTISESEAVVQLMHDDAATLSESAGVSEPSHEAIAAEAYARYAARGYQNGGDVDDWLMAEDTLRRPRVNVSGLSGRES
jgi:hypothetical protein